MYSVVLQMSHANATTVISRVLKILKILKYLKKSDFSRRKITTVSATGR